ncbi:lysoplasmalogenase family protein [Microbacterium sp. SORGH_AS_0888]|uniref:lysoplasmalogenase family protein n=1 Tax=Microbacterium sp. SORGH_AS_0888 TaxID=3041791 RepID=UPI002789A832|nr:lysoplasmalogenase family protein [Microbacterium sp. SORGH_AS_0888]MDQ1129006.1 apolipoprotein N-acyltransferase [Microbacterium sp. SORGH_AS_0888]
MRIAGSTPARGRWWGFLPYATLSAVHVGALAVDAEPLASFTKLTLMPLLALALLWAGRGTSWGTPFALLFAALAFSWLGDGAATFFPFAPTVPAMLLCFGAAHICYLVLFSRRLARRRLPRWSAVYALWWIGMLLLLGPALLPAGGVGLLVGVAVYGLLLAATAATAARCTPAIALGGALFLCSDTVLAFRLFTPDSMPGWTSPLVMVAYCLGQGLLVAGSAALLVHRPEVPR